VVGRVVRSHGLRGEVSIESQTDLESRFAIGSQLWVGSSNERLRVASCRVHHGRILVQFEGYDERASADGLRGRELMVAQEEVPPAPADHYYHFELVGCRVLDATNRELGVVARVVEDGGGLLLELEGSGPGLAPGLLIPFVQAFVDRVDAEAGVIVVDLPPGLIDTCRGS
jgi:16S rRNA processing protein RimM